MQQEYTDVTFLLDRSGSMKPIRHDTIGGYNMFVESQRQVPGRCTLTLIQFDDQYEPKYEGMDLHAVPDLTEATYVPRGATALNDAVMRAIARTGERLSALPEAERPGKVVIVISTDGQENSSQFYLKRDVLKKISEQERRWNWQFIFLGAFADAFDEASSLGIQPDKTIRVSKTSVGTQAAYGAVSQTMAQFRTGATPSMTFTQAHQDAQDADAQAHPES